MSTHYEAPTNARIHAIVRNAKVVAVLGMKGEASPDAPAFTVPRRMQQNGIAIIPINPTLASALGVKALASISELTASVDVLQVFRRSEAIGGIADEVLALPANLRPKVVWLQSGIVHAQAAAKLAAAGMEVVMDRCFAVEMTLAGMP